MAASPRAFFSRLVLIAAFAAVASSAGLQWAGLSAQSEASRQQVSRQTLAEFSSVLNQYERTPAPEKHAVAEQLTGVAERLSQQVWGESLASAARRVVALASYEPEADSREKELQERLRAEVRGLVGQAESMESAALGRATLLSTINQALLVIAAVLCGMALFRAGRAGATV
ncbi:MAG: hypothetical protein HYX27_03895 [Acidobacteria bacterium]|nr:hypothetical protein [Acidobacteriota bacterium]